MMKSKCIIFLLLILGISSTQAQMKVYNKYMPINLNKDTAFTNYFKKFKEVIMTNNRDEVYNFLKNDLPIQVSVDGAGKNQQNSRIKIVSKKQFLAVYPRVFDSRMRDFIKKQTVSNAKLMVEGIMLGRGQFWWHYYKIDKRIKISSISNLELILCENALECDYLK